MMKKLLIIDDESIITRALSRAFQKESLEISVAQDGVEGYESIKKGKPDLILLDIMMPKMTGIELLQKIRNERNQTPVILMTAYGDTETEKMAKDLGVSAYLKKPFENIEDVIALVKSKI